MSAYQELIREDMARLGLIGAVNPRHVEAWMRCEHPTLDALSRPQFAAEVAAGVACAQEAPADLSERLAHSYGVRRDEQ